eukprot:TRINITY_DN15253_c0_g1_i2.p1 TRINITY_DN15253_c0_g1~~TRINITY_DN15253_c0_g1_i2.p1  ORF type:complete len:101 (-),score=0.36 TRINITY_DN15253_c0_g1_i2:4-306(-)
MKNAVFVSRAMQRFFLDFCLTTHFFSDGAILMERLLLFSASSLLQLLVQKWWLVIATRKVSPPRSLIGLQARACFFWMILTINKKNGVGCAHVLCVDTTA